MRAPAAPTITAFRGPPLLRFVLLPSNEVYARFADTLVHLNASAAAFSLLAPDGTSTRGLVRTATAAVRTRLALALHLRNTLVAPSRTRSGRIVVAAWAVVRPQRGLNNY